MSEPNDLVPQDGTPIDNQKLIEAISTTNNETDFQQIVSLFNLNQNKKRMIRAIKFESLLDQICDEMIFRFQTNPDTFGNQSLLDYLTAIQKSNVSILNPEDLLEHMPKISVQNNTQINVNGSTLDSQSREKVRELISNILSNNGGNIIG